MTIRERLGKQKPPKADRVHVQARILPGLKNAVLAAMEAVPEQLAMDDVITAGLEQFAEEVLGRKRFEEMIRKK